MTPATRALITDAIAIIEGEREISYTSNKEHDGVVRDEAAKVELDKFDDWLTRRAKRWGPQA